MTAIPHLPALAGTRLALARNDKRMYENGARVVTARPAIGMARHRGPMNAHHRTTLGVLALLALLAAGSCGRGLGSEPLPTRDPDATTASTPVAIVGVNVVPMTSNTVLRDQTIVIRGGVIELLGPDWLEWTENRKAVNDRAAAPARTAD